MNPTDEGRYIGRPIKWAVGKSKEGAAEFACEFALTQYHNDHTKEWADVEHEGLTIIGYFYPISKSGQPVEGTIDNLRDSLGWSGTSLDELNNGHWDQTEVQLTLQNETFNNRTRMKVKWINPRDSSGGGVRDANPDTVKTLDRQFGALLRAHSKTAPASRPANGNGKAAAPLTDAQQSRKAAWVAFNTANRELDKDAIADKWKSACAAYFKGKPQEIVGSAEWDEFIANDFKRAAPENPISDEPVFVGVDEPPF